MNQIQEKKIVYFLKLSHLFDTHSDEIFRDKNVLRDVNVFNARLDSIQQELINAANSTNKIVTEVLIARSLVVKLCNKISSVLKSYAKNNNFGLLTRDLYLDYNTLSDGELLEYSTKILEEALPVETDITKTDLTDSEILSFKNLINNLKQIVTASELMMKLRANTSEAFDENIEQNEILVAELDKLLNSNEHKQFNSEYLNVKEFAAA